MMKMVTYTKHIVLDPSGEKEVASFEINDGSRDILVRTQGKQFVITEQDRDKFVELLNNDYE